MAREEERDEGEAEFPDSRAGRIARWINESPAALWLIGLASFLEAMVVPIPLELVMIPILFWRRHQTWLICTIVTVACLVGAGLFYGVGFFFFDRFGEQVISLFGGDDGTADRMRDFMDAHGFWAVLMIAVTPIPFQIGMLLAGASGYPFSLFLLAAAIGRGIRYFGLGFLVKRYGTRAAEVWKKHRLKVALLAGAVVLALWWLSRLAANLF